MRNLFRLIGRFRREQRGNIAVIFALALVPMVSAIGCAVDYSRASQIRRGRRRQRRINREDVGSLYCRGFDDDRWAD